MNPVDHADLRARVRQALAEFLAGQRDHMKSIDEDLLPLADAVEAFVLGGGKRLRPAFAYWGARSTGAPDSQELINAVATLELVQAGALIHDDLMDASDTRRGEPSVHRRFEAMHAATLWHGRAEQFGAASAVLLGDLCLVWSDEMLHRSGFDPGTVLLARATFDQMRTEVMLGQYLDVLSQVTGDTSPQRASLVARYKSAKYSVEHPLLFGAVLAGADTSLLQIFSAFGLPLGEAFQLRDDVLGVFGDPATTGKPAGDDLREGKRTYLMAVAFAGAADDTDRELLAKSLGDPGLDDSTVADLREVILRSGALERTEERIEELTAAALTALAAADITEQARLALSELADSAVHRST
ncbi:polyprenyl synthetase family protein [Rhizocola hellebori]|nr:polyprenyl synthetase family protein [Rhizocola hellebori]